MDHNSQQQLGQTLSLLANTTGVLELLRLRNSQGDDWLIPSALVLAQSRLDTLAADAQYVDYETQQVPVYRGLLPKVITDTLTVLVLEGENDVQRIAVVLDQQPELLKVTISRLRDRAREVEQPYDLQPVLLDDQPCLVPDLDQLTSHLCL